MTTAEQRRGILDELGPTEYVRYLLYDLGPTADMIANRLRDLGVKGLRDDSKRCPIAQYLDANGVEGAVVVADDGITFAGGRTGRYDEYAPAVREFIGRFDCGFYPDLCAPEGTTP